MTGVGRRIGSDSDDQRPSAPSAAINGNQQPSVVKGTEPHGG
ncbi:hypothetical protein SBD_1424 [Streptomyces bottropensis ATCC 25435]|uniref:Uncharacterized protein n=1 Tax=Streptomyces bottropensis ATCC 25435 TaxID=1054862 RepID=M3DK74_9ACTN|nr:hypothetical protein SBD_1424 [Streptomyces bottropensis ATCC 25435]